MSGYGSVGVASLIMMGSVFLSRVIGLAREMVIAYIGGAGGDVDAYQVAFVLPEILNHLLAAGFLSVTFIPIFSRHLAQGNEAEGWRVFSIILTGFGALLLGLILIGMVFTPQVIPLMAPGIVDPRWTARTVRMTRIILPGQLFFFAGGLLMAVQFAKGKFLIPALAPLLYNLGIILGGLVLGPRLGMEGFCWGALGGACLGNFLVQTAGARAAGLRYVWATDFRHPDLNRYIVRSLPLMVGLTMAFSTEIFLKFFGSYLPPGSIAGLNYGLRIMFILVGIFGQAVGVASFPFMARLAVEGNLPELNRLLNQTLKFLAVIIPFSVLFMVLRREVVAVLFQRGRFDAAAAALTANALSFLMIGTVAFAAQTVVSRGYYARENTLFPSAVGSLCALGSLPVYYLGMRFMGVGGVALAVSVSALLQAWLLFALWNRRSGNREGRAVYGLYFKITVLSAGIGAVLAWGRPLIAACFPSDSPVGALVTLTLCGGIFAFLLFSGGRLAGVREIDIFYKRIAEKTRSKFFR